MNRILYDDIHDMFLRFYIRNHEIIDENIKTYFGVVLPLSILVYSIIVTIRNLQLIYRDDYKIIVFPLIILVLIYDLDFRFKYHIITIIFLFLILMARKDLIYRLRLKIFGKEKRIFIKRTNINFEVIKNYNDRCNIINSFLRNNILFHIYLEIDEMRTNFEINDEICFVCRGSEKLYVGNSLHKHIICLECLEYPYNHTCGCGCGLYIYEYCKIENII